MSRFAQACRRAREARRRGPRRGHERRHSAVWSGRERAGRPRRPTPPRGPPPTPLHSHAPTSRPRGVGTTRACSASSGTTDPWILATDPRLSDALLLRAYREMKRLQAARRAHDPAPAPGPGRLLRRVHRPGGDADRHRASRSSPTDWVFPALRESVMMLVRGFPLRDLPGAGLRQLGRHPAGAPDADAHERAAGEPGVLVELHRPAAPAGGRRRAGRRSSRRDSAVAVGFMGDGATSEPDFHSRNEARGVFTAPCVMICQNNHWADQRADGPADRLEDDRRQAAAPTASRRCGSTATTSSPSTVPSPSAVARARAGGGPSFIEALTYRVGAHSSSDDPSRYRPQEEVEIVGRSATRCCASARHLVRPGGSSTTPRRPPSRRSSTPRSPPLSPRSRPWRPPARETLFDDVYAELPWHLRGPARRAPAPPKAPAHGGGR